MFTEAEALCPINSYRSTQQAFHLTFLAVRPLIYRFALKYTENNREFLSKFTEAGAIEKYLDRQGLLNQFADYGSKNGVKKDAEGIKISGKIIFTQLKAYIARNIT